MFMYIFVHIYIYIYTHTHPYTYNELPGQQDGRGRAHPEDQRGRVPGRDCRCPAYFIGLYRFIYVQYYIINRATI